MYVFSIPQTLLLLAEYDVITGVSHPWYYLC